MISEYNQIHHFVLCCRCSSLLDDIPLVPSFVKRDGLVETQFVAPCAVCGCGCMLDCHWTVQELESRVPSLQARRDLAMDVQSQRARALFVAVGGRVGSGMYRSQAERYKAMTGMVNLLFA